jgi:nitroimidazol reductase NimA-like FMN-containing flavoprotein (pyridoxamine 5'-phosphate oxidase superfamily)
VPGQRRSADEFGGAVQSYLAQDAQALAEKRMQMSRPVTTLDQRYSGAEALAITWDQTRGVLEAAELSWISTVRADGRPHVTPVVTVWADEALWFSTGAEEQKFANLRANPNVVVTTGCNSWDHGLDVVVEGQAAHVTDEDVLRRVAQAFATRWEGGWQFTVRDGRFRNLGAGDWPSEVFSVTPTKVFAHAKGDPFGATTHRF